MQIFIQGKDQRNAMDMREQLYMLEIEKHRGIKDAAQALHITLPTVDPTAELAKAAIRFCGYGVRGG